MSACAEGIRTRAHSTTKVKVNPLRKLRGFTFIFSVPCLVCRDFITQGCAMPRKNFTDSSLTFAPKRRIYAVGRRERSKKLKLFPLAFFYCTPFLHETQGASVNFFHGGYCGVNRYFRSAGALLKKASCWFANAFNVTQSCVPCALMRAAAHLF